MKIFCDFTLNERARDISSILYSFGIGWNNIRNEFVEDISVRVITIPKTKQALVLENFKNEIKQGCPSKWLEPLGITHYWEEEDFPPT